MEGKWEFEKIKIVEEVKWSVFSSHCNCWLGDSSSLIDSDEKERKKKLDKNQYDEESESSGVESASDESESYDGSESESDEEDGDEILKTQELLLES